MLVHPDPRTALASYTYNLMQSAVSYSSLSVCLFLESLTDRVGRRRSMPGSTVDKTVVAMDADTSTPFKVTVRIYESSKDKKLFIYNLKSV